MASFRCSHCNRPAISYHGRRDILEGEHSGKLVVLCERCSAEWDSSEGEEREAMKRTILQRWQDAG